MAQVLAANTFTGTAAQLRAGRNTSSASRAQRLPVLAQGFRGSRFDERQQRRNTRFHNCRPRSFQGPRFGMGFDPTEFQFSTSDLSKLMQDLEKAFSGGQTGEADADLASFLTVPVDAVEEVEAYSFTADLPGVSRADTKVQTNKEERSLTISGERVKPELSEEQRQSRRRTERRFGKFKRTFKLPEDADLNAVSATFKDGVLVVNVKRTKPAEPDVTEVPIDDWFDVTPEN